MVLGCGGNGRAGNEKETKSGIDDGTKKIENGDATWEKAPNEQNAVKKER